MRNWLYAFALANQAPETKGKFTVIPFPSWEDGGRASVLGGHNMVISTYSENPAATLKFIDYMTSAERMERNAVKYSKPPVLTATYADADVKRAIPVAARSSSRRWSRPSRGPCRRSTRSSHRRSTRT